MFRLVILGLVTGTAVTAVAQDVQVKQVPLSSLDLSKMSAGWGTPLADRSIQGKPLSIGGRRFKHGVGTHAPSSLYILLDGRTRRFVAQVGVDDETNGRGSVRFLIFADDRPVFDSGVLRGGQPPKTVDVQLDGCRKLLLMVTSAGDNIHFDHADWAEAFFEVAGNPPQATERPEVKEKPILLTPAPPQEPRINGPRVYGCRPGHPFLYRIPCTGKRPVRFAAKGLPAGLTLDPETGILSGHAPQQPGTYTLTLKAENALGKDERVFRIIVGETLALTPPMGWNHWYTYYNRISDELFRKAADSMISSGMADFGYQYVNIDDCWSVRPGSKDPILGAPPRGPNQPIRPNKRFPDMRALCNYIHSKGLKAGIYTSPGPLTCAGYEGSYQHEKIDAQTFAHWGFDFLKYDWCSYGRVVQGRTIEDWKRPYKKMGDILKRLDRDIVFNLCQYGRGKVWTWGAEVGGNCWRTTGDLGLQQANRFPGFYRVGLRNAQLWEFAGPGHWNDPDYILIGIVGNARNPSAPPRSTPLTPNEQYSYMSMWCLMAAPLIYSGDITHLDRFTLNVLCNAEVIAVDQDELGKQARVVRQSEWELVLAKPLSDGSLAVGLFNLSEMARTVKATWEELNLSGKQTVRDLWRQKDLGSVQGQVGAEIPRHGVFLVKLSPAK